MKYAKVRCSVMANKDVRAGDNAYIQADPRQELWSDSHYLEQRHPAGYARSRQVHDSDDTAGPSSLGELRLAKALHRARPVDSSEGMQQNDNLLSLANQGLQDLVEHKVNVGLEVRVAVWQGGGRGRAANGFVPSFSQSVTEAVIICRILPGTLNDSK